MSIIIYIFTVIIAFFSSLFPSETVMPETLGDFAPELCFTVMSDTHINGPDDFKLQRIVNGINFGYELAEQDNCPYGLSAVLFCGDISDNGKDEQFAAFDSTVKATVKGDTKILGVVAKNHDSSVSHKNSTSWVEKITGNPSDFHVVINGYHFIGISTSENEAERYSLSQRIWLEKQLKQAASERGNKPIFVIHHEHVKGTVYGEEGWGVTYFTDILAQYPQVVDFSGHSHYPVNDPRSIWQGTFTCVGTGSMNYMEMSTPEEDTIHPENSAKAQYWVVEVSSDNRIRLRGIAEEDNAVLCDYVITVPVTTENAAYSEKNQKARASAPQFDEDAKLNITEDADNYYVTVPAAKSTDGNPVFLYRIKVTNAKDKKVSTEYIINNYWSSQTYESVTFTVAKKNCANIYVTAENSYEMASDPLFISIN